MLFRSDRKSTRLNSSHTIISYAVFCLKKKRTRERGGGGRGGRRWVGGEAVCPARARAHDAPPLLHLPDHHDPAFHSLFFFFFNDTATTEIYTLSLHDALPISIAVTAPNQIWLTVNRPDM